MRPADFIDKIKDKYDAEDMTMVSDIANECREHVEREFPGLRKAEQAHIARELCRTYARVMDWLDMLAKDEPEGVDIFGLLEVFADSAMLASADIAPAGKPEAYGMYM